MRLSMAHKFFRSAERETDSLFTTHHSRRSYI